MTTPTTRAVSTNAPVVRVAAWRRTLPWCGAVLCSALLVACSDGDSRSEDASSTPSSGGGQGDTPPIDGAPGDPTSEPGQSVPGGENPDDRDPPVPVSVTLPANLPQALSPRDDDLFPTLDPYEVDGYGSNEVLRVDVRTVPGSGPCTADDRSGCTLADVLADTDNDDDFKAEVPIHFSATDFPDDGLAINADLRQRGNSARGAPQKSFRIKLEDKEALWRGERKLFLNKHPFENSRIRNRLSMELMRDIPYLASLRTQFVNLWIDDGNGAEDKGLFTHVEAPGGRWLEKRGFDKDDNLYKASFLRFYPDDRNGLRTDEQGQPLNDKEFDTLLEIENGDEHSALVRMLDKLHDPAVDFDTVLDEHFNRNNLLVWLATNILMHQTDGVTHNYLLHNPKGTERFYFVPWDYDGTLFSETEPDPVATDNDALNKRLFYGYARNINNTVITRFLQMPGAHERMVEVAEWLAADYLNAEIVDAKATGMAASVEPFRARAPDNANFIAGYRPTNPGAFSGSITDNLEALRTRFSVPMPPTLRAPERQGSQWSFSWTPAIEVTGNALQYDLQVSRSLAFLPGDIVVSRTGIPDADGLVEAQVDAGLIPAGVHYVRVTARASNDPARFWQVPTNVVQQDGRSWLGMLRFEVQ